MVEQRFATTDRSRTIEAAPGDLEALRVAMYPVGHLDRCEEVVAAAVQGRIVADDFVIWVLRKARNTLIAEMREQRLEWSAHELGQATRRLAAYDGLLWHVVEAARA